MVARMLDLLFWFAKEGEGSFLKASVMRSRSSNVKNPTYCLYSLVPQEDGVVCLGGVSATYSCGWTTFGLTGMVVWCAQVVRISLSYCEFSLFYISISWWSCLLLQ